MTVVPLRNDPATVPETMTGYQRMMASALAPMTVQCPRCDEPRGMDCRSTGGYTVPFHAPRLAAVDHLTDDERVAAFAALRAEQKRRLAEGEAQRRQLLSDPQWVAQRDATRAWWNTQFDRIDREQHAEEADLRSRCADAPFLGFRAHADGCRCLHTGEVEFTAEFAQAKADRERRESLRGALPVTDLAARRGVQ
jgi:hypothetical protein